MRDGLRSLAFRVKNGEILVQQTDMSGDLAIMTREEYNTGSSDFDLLIIINYHKEVW